MSVVLPAEPAENTKRGILTNLAKVYDPLGLVSPVILDAKPVYREACTQGLIAVKSRIEKQGLTIPRLELEYLRAKNVLDKMSTTTKH